MSDSSDRPTEKPASRRAAPSVLLLIAGGIGAIAVLLLALSIPVSAAPAWIGIALEVALFAALAISALSLPDSPYRRRMLQVTLIGMVAVAVVLLLGIWIVTWTTSG